MPVEVTLPQLGESTFEGTIGKWLKQPGDRVERFEPLGEIITDKVNGGRPPGRRKAPPPPPPPPPPQQLPRPRRRQPSRPPRARQAHGCPRSCGAWRRSMVCRWKRSSGSRGPALAGGAPRENISKTREGGRRGEAGG